MSVKKLFLLFSNSSKYLFKYFLYLISEKSVSISIFKKDIKGHSFNASFLKIDSGLEGVLNHRRQEVTVCHDIVLLVAKVFRVLDGTLPRVLVSRRHANGNALAILQEVADRPGRDAIDIVREGDRR